MNPALNRLLELQRLGQKVWVDELHRTLLRSGRLASLIDDDGICGVTSNPTIFQRAFSEDENYREDVQKQLAAGTSPEQIYENLAIEDVRDAADALAGVYRNSGGYDGYVSLEVPPRLAHDTAATIVEAGRLCRLLDRPNVMIKVPGTRAGLPAIRQLTCDGIHINVTLLFGVARCREVFEAFAAGLESRASAGREVAGIVSVVSLFVSRIDSVVDRELQALLEREHSPRVRSLLGEAGVQVARSAYQDHRKFLESPRWLALAAAGARPQRLLWASTSTKNPAYSDVKYLDELIGRDTITTVSLPTLDAFRDHGRLALTVERDPYEIATLPAELLQLGIDLHRVSERLETEGLRKFSASFDAMLAGLSCSGVVETTVR